MANFKERFTIKLQEQVADNPLLALGVGAAALTAAAKLITSVSEVQGRRVYAKEVNRRVKKDRYK